MCESDTRSHWHREQRGYREIGRGERPRTPQKGKRGYREIGRDGARGERPRTPQKGKRGYRESRRERVREEQPKVHPGPPTCASSHTHNQYTCDQSLYTCVRDLRLAPQCFHIRLVIHSIRYLLSSKVTLQSSMKQARNFAITLTEAHCQDTESTRYSRRKS